MGKKDTIVIGLGNPLMADEGIGIRVVEKLIERAGEFDEVEFVNGGTGGMNILHIIAGRKKAVIVDCALMDTRAGTIKRFTPEQVRTQKVLSHQSLHDADIIKVIELSRQLGEGPDEVVFFGIEPETIEQRMSLSDTLEKSVDSFIRTVAEEIAA